MKKFLGWFLLITCPLVMLVVFQLVINVFRGNEENGFRNPFITSSGPGLILLTVLSYFGIRYGLKQVRKQKPQQPVPFNKTLDMQLSGRIEYKEYRNLILGLTYRKPIMILPFFLLFIYTISLFTLDDLSDAWEMGIFFFVWAAIIPFATISQIKKVYRTQKFLHEMINFRLDNEALHVKGDTVESKMNWNHFYKFQETKDFFLFYTGAGVATFLKKSMFSEQQLSEFREFTKSLTFNNTND